MVQCTREWAAVGCLALVVSSGCYTPMVDTSAGATEDASTNADGSDGEDPTADDSKGTDGEQSQSAADSGDPSNDGGDTSDDASASDGADDAGASDGADEASNSADGAETDDGTDEGDDADASAATGSDEAEDSDDGDDTAGDGASSDDANDDSTAGETTTDEAGDDDTSADDSTTGTESSTASDGDDATSSTDDVTAGDDGTTDDPVCDQQCVPEAPGGWSGPIAMYDGAFATAPPTCAGDYARTERSVLGQPDPGRHQCSCSCQPSDLECESFDTGRFGESGCRGSFTAGFRSGGDWDGEVSAGDRCLVEGAGDFPTGIVWTYGVPSNERPGITGQCRGSSSTVIDEVSWARRGLACGATQTPNGEGCSAGHLCMPDTPSRFAGKHCIYTEGEDVSCPSGPYSNGKTYYQRADDDRICTPCGGCGQPEGSCEGTLTIYRSDNCSSTSEPGVIEIGPNAAMCDNFNSRDNEPLSVSVDLRASGSCRPPSGGDRQGVVSYEQAITVCCQ